MRDDSNLAEERQEFRDPSLLLDDHGDCRPFVKWVGGKGQLLPLLCQRLPSRFGRYFEPFVGGGAFFFRLRPHRAHLSDVNPELINAYLVVQSQVDALIRSLRRHVYDKEYYYKVRSADRLPGFENWSAVRRASRLIYLNKTCFNGLYRVNSKGHFNTPFGRYTDPTIVDDDNLHACSQVLQTAEVVLEPFEAVAGRVCAGDFVYFDPPYVPVSDTAYFTGYAKDGFGPDMQGRLAELCHRLDKKGVKFMLSNSSCDFVRNLYRKFRIEIVHASRAVNSKAALRGKVEEVIVRNY